MVWNLLVEPAIIGVNLEAVMSAERFSSEGTLVFWLDNTPGSSTCPLRTCSTDPEEQGLEPKHTTRETGHDILKMLARLP